MSLSLPVAGPGVSHGASGMFRDWCHGLAILGDALGGLQEGQGFTRVCHGPARGAPEGDYGFDLDQSAPAETIVSAAARDRVCALYVDPQQATRLAPALQAAGYVAMAHRWMIARTGPAPVQAPAARVLPGRSAYGLVERLLRQCCPDSPGTVAARLAMLDEPRYDLLLLVDADGTPLGMAAVLTVNQSGLVRDVCLGPGAAPGPVALLMSELLDLCTRARHQRVFALVQTGDPSAPALGQAGFIPVPGPDVWTAGQTTGRRGPA